MPIALLTLMKFALLLLLYLFLLRVVRVLVIDVYGPRRRAAAPPRQAVAVAEQPNRSGKAPKEIVVHSPGARPKVAALRQSGVVLGRAEHADLMVDDVYVSDEHAEIMPQDGGWSVRDLGSTNGTFLNGAKVTQPTPLAAGDQLRLGKTRVEVRR